MRRLLASVCLCLALAVVSSAYTRITSSSTGNSAHWPSMPINYFINQQGSNQIANDSEFVAVHAAFQTWADIPSANIRFNYLGPAVITAGSADTVNLVSFSDATFPWSSGTLAVTLNYFSSSTGITSEADILFNPNQLWSTSGESGKFDIQSVLTHEIGHFLGLDHSGMVSSVLAPFGSPGVVDQRTLQYDDIAGVTEIYPVGPSLVGQIAGSVTANGNPVNGAHVVAVDSSGTPLVGTVSGSNGTYTLRSLPAGAYRVYAEPLDGPVVESNLGSFYRNLNINFGTTYYPNASTLPTGQTVIVSTGTVTTGIEIQALPRSVSGLNITRPVIAPRIGRSISGTLTVSGVDLTSGTVFSSSNPTDVILGAPIYGTTTSSTSPTTAALALTVSPTAALGPKNIAVNRGNDGAVGTGAVVVTERPPSGIVVTPAAGPAGGGVRVSVAGANFRAGARVYFGGMPSADARFISSTLLDVLTAANTAGSALVQVINADGTAGVSAAGYVYETPAPVISGIAPLTGPPATLVTIDGTGFDPFSSVVFFNGVRARTISATATRLTTAVPYGSTTGAVSVLSNNQTATGPSFTVTAAIGTSTNLAPSSYTFTDASVNAGGTSVTFTNNDDGATAATLPFTFSLFRDIYPAGSQITITTNGFLSLEAGAASEFQNGTLPSTTASKPAASGCFNISAETRSMPRALVGPFFDDLVAIPGVSSVSTRVVGSEPNRRFIVQWSRLSILDESGCDLHSTITFQAVLFEGSNDVMFVYPSLSGPRSAGDSATVGMQDSARITGIQTSFNQATLRSEWFVTYRFSNGAYAAVIGDTTPPLAPVVLDEGAATNSTTILSASWTTDDPESGIREYQYGLGTSPGATNIVPFTSTTANFVVLNGLSLSPGTTYYFAVRAVNGAGLTSEVGVSDGIVVTPSLTTAPQIIPFVQHNAARYTGIALLAPAAMTVTLKAIDNGGSTVSSTTVTLNPGQQFARLVSELFNVNTFEGWVQVEGSAAGLGVFSATGSRDNRDLDGAVPRPSSSDFVAMHPNATLWLVNPSSQAATVTFAGFGTAFQQTLTIPGRSRISTTLPTIARVTSTQPLAAIEVIEAPGKLGLSVPESPTGATTLTFPDALMGGDYFSTVTLVNVGSAGEATIRFGSTSRVVQLAANSANAFNLNDLFPAPAAVMPDAVRVTMPLAQQPGGPSLLGVVDISNPRNTVSMGARPATTEFLFPHVAHGGDLFTGLCLVSGSAGATITIDVYNAAGDVRKSNTITLGPSQQIARLVSELVPAVTSQLGGYIRIRSDQQILAWEIFGSDNAFASGPPL